MNDTFRFRRFFTYFKYDLIQIWRNHGRALLVISGLGLLAYVVAILFNLTFRQQWQAPDELYRAIVLVISYTALELYQARVYGHLTDRKAGSAWLMVPASRAEKFVSMLLNVLVIIPVLFLVVFFLLDGFLSLVDPTVESSLAAAFTGWISDVRPAMAEFNAESPFTFGIGTAVGFLLLGNAVNFTFFLLCGICFKKYKIVGALVVTWIASVVLSLLSMAAIIPNVGRLEEMTDEAAVSMSVAWMNGSVVFSCLLLAGLAWGVWRRIKTIQH